MLGETKHWAEKDTPDTMQHWGAGCVWSHFVSKTCIIIIMYCVISFRKDLKVWTFIYMKKSPALQV